MTTEWKSRMQKPIDDDFDSIGSAPNYDKMKIEEIDDENEIDRVD